MFSGARLSGGDYEPATPKVLVNAQNTFKEHLRRC